MRHSLPLITAASLPRSNMTAPENNFCYATDLAPISEPDRYGVGIIGIASFKRTSETFQPRNPAVPEQG